MKLAQVLISKNGRGLKSNDTHCRLQNCDTLVITNLRPGDLGPLVFSPLADARCTNYIRYTILCTILPPPPHQERILCSSPYTGH